MPVDSNNICSNLTLNILRGEEGSEQSIFAWKKVSVALQGLLCVCIFKTFILALFPGKRYLLFPALLSLLCVGGYAAPWRGQCLKPSGTVLSWLSLGL